MLVPATTETQRVLPTSASVISSWYLEDTIARYVINIIQHICPFQI